MHTQSKLMIVLASLLIIILVSCNAAPKNALEENHPTAPPVPTVTSAPAEAPAITPTSSSDLLTSAAVFCEKAFLSSASNELPRSPVFTLLNKEYEGPEWQSWGTEFYESQSVSEVRTIVCIRETRTIMGQYSDYATAYRLDAQVRLVRWPDGIVLKATDTFLLGGDPPHQKNHSGPGYGEWPRLPILAWITAALEDPTVIEHGSSVTDLDFSPDGKVLATAAFDNNMDSTVKLWNVATGQLLNTFDGHDNAVLSIVFSPDGNTLASGSQDFTLILWDTTTGQKKYTFEGHSGGVTDLTFSPDGKTLASASTDNTIILWDASSGNKIRTITYGDAIYTVSFSPDQRFLASGNGDGTVIIWDVFTREEFQTLIGHEGGINSVAFSLDGNYLASGDWNGEAKIWDLSTGQLLRTLNLDWGRINSIAFSPDGKVLATGGEQGVILWNVMTGEQIQTIQDFLYTTGVIFSPDGSTLASCHADGTVKIWQIIFSD